MFTVLSSHARPRPPSCPQVDLKGLQRLLQACGQVGCRLEHLSLEGNPLGSRVLLRLESTLAQAQHLRVLNLAHTHLDAAAGPALLHILERLPNLRLLQAGSNLVNWQGGALAEADLTRLSTV